MLSYLRLDSNHYRWATAALSLADPLPLSSTHSECTPSRDSRARNGLKTPHTSRGAREERADARGLASEPSQAQISGSRSAPQLWWIRSVTLAISSAVTDPVSPGSRVSKWKM